jgi:hypothetical protein
MEQTPLAWLFAELARLYGQDTANALHTEYLARNRAYQIACKKKARERDSRALGHVPILGRSFHAP